jgi:hypothetical protein
MSEAPSTKAAPNAEEVPGAPGTGGQGGSQGDSGTVSAPAPDQGTQTGGDNDPGGDGPG